MRKTLIALIAIVSIGTVLPTVASARGGFHGGGYRAVSWGGGWRAGYRWHGPDWWGVTGIGGYGYGYGYPYGYYGAAWPGVAVGGWFLAHRHGQLKGEVSSLKSKV